MRRPAPWLAAVFLTASVVAEESGPPWTREQGVIYGEKAGAPLTLDVFRPAAGANGAGVIMIVSGGWASSRGAINEPYAAHFLKHGFTVFAVVHGSCPPHFIPAIIPDAHRAVRFIRRGAARFGVDPARLGATGASSGGHLALILGTQGGPGAPDAADPVDRESSAVQAVACFFPPTDFLNYVRPGVNALDESVLKNFRKFIGPVPADQKARDALGRSISPIYSVSAATAPTLIIHGEKDWNVMPFQSSSFVEAAKNAGVTAKLILKPGKAHGWPGMGEDVETLAGWFERILSAKTPAAK